MCFISDPEDIATTEVPPHEPLTTDELTQALHTACSQDRPDEVRSLLQRGANVNGPGVNRCSRLSPLHVACRNAEVEVVKVLLENGADVDVKTGWKSGKTPLITACIYGRVDVIGALIQHHADVNLKDNGGTTPLLAACMFGHEECVDALIQHHADVNLGCAGDNTPLIMACGYPVIVQRLLDVNDIDINHTNTRSWTALHMAGHCGNVDVVKILLNHKESNVNASGTAYGHTPLFLACTNGHDEAAGALVQHHADVNIADNEGDTPLIAACSQGHRNIIQRLLDISETDVNQSNKKSATALHMACLNGHADIVELLVNHKAVNVNAKASNGYTPLHAACLRKHVQVARILLAHGADVNATTSIDLSK